ncbi:MAG: hypothetical protein IT461_14930 [Planctomycetes bacterium]|jgi:hypothetical protein|nr:hypothetical protein [Planctomycetota bacterium]
MAEQKKKGSSPVKLLVLLILVVAAAGILGWAAPNTPVIGPAVTSIRNMMK